jgi:glucan 1,3-beta-glucosidase
MLKTLASASIASLAVA